MAWTATRARQEEEYIRRAEGNRYASRFETRAFQLTRPFTTASQSQPIIIDLTEEWE
jgi:hypothetical protein